MIMNRFNHCNDNDMKAMQQLSNIEDAAFAALVKAYKENGVRMVALDFGGSDDEPAPCSTLYAFYTDGVNAEQINKERFLTKDVLEHAASYGMGASDLSLVIDATDDEGKLDGYDHDPSCYPIHQLVDIDMTGTELGVDEYGYYTNPGFNHCPVCGTPITQQFNDPCFTYDSIWVTETCPHCHSEWGVTYDFHHLNICKDGRFNKED